MRPGSCMPHVAYSRLELLCAVTRCNLPAGLPCLWQLGTCASFALARRQAVRPFFKAFLGQSRLS